MSKDVEEDINIKRFRNLIRFIGRVIVLMRKKEYIKAVEKLRTIQALCEFAMNLEKDKQNKR